jgi:hypothetical protein
VGKSSSAVHQKMQQNTETIPYIRNMFGVKRPPVPKEASIVLLVTPASYRTVEADTSGCAKARRRGAQSGCRHLRIIPPAA